MVEIVDKNAFEVWQCRVICYFFVGFKIIILSFAHSIWFVWFMKHVFLAKTWFVKTSSKHLCDGYGMDIMWCLCVEVKGSYGFVMLP